MHHLNLNEPKSNPTIVNKTISLSSESNNRAQKDAVRTSKLCNTVGLYQKLKLLNTQSQKLFSDKQIKMEKEATL